MNSSTKSLRVILLILIIVGSIGSLLPNVLALPLEVSASPGSKTTVPGGTVTFAIYVSISGTIPGNPNVKLSVTPTTASLIGLSFSFTVNNKPAPFTSSMIVHVDPTKASGTYRIPILAHPVGYESGKFDETTSVYVVVGGGFDFNIALSPFSATVVQGEIANYQILLTYSAPSYSGTVVTIQVTGLGPGMNYQLSTSGNLAISTSATTPAGTYPITVMGSAQGVAHQTSGTVIVTAKAPTFDYSIAITPSTQAVALGKTSAYTVTVSLAGGEGKTITLSLTGLPADIQHRFSAQSGTPTFISTLTIDTSSLSSTGTYTITVIGSGGEFARTATATLTVEESVDFSVTMTSQANTIKQGESASFAVKLDKVGEFDQAVALVVTGLPTGASPTFAPASGKPPFTSILNITTTLSTPTGTFKVTVDASSGSKTHSAEVSLYIKEKSKETETSTSSPETKGGNSSQSDLTALFLNQTSLMVITIILLFTILALTLSRRRRGPETPRPLQRSARYCVNCGAPLSPGEAFCSACDKSSARADQSCYESPKARRQTRSIGMSNKRY